MEIKYLKLLEKYPVQYFDEISFVNVQLSEQQIAHLEQLYNNSNPFPKALRELLFLAGGSCYVLDMALEETQEEMQDFVRASLQAMGKSISKNFYVIDIYNSLEQFLFVYLDEGDDPLVYNGRYYDNETRPSWIAATNRKLSGLIDSRVEQAQKGDNPF